MMLGGAGVPVRLQGWCGLLLRMRYFGAYISAAPYRTSQHHSWSGCKQVATPWFELVQVSQYVPHLLLRPYHNIHTFC